jgi:hypothetical protein
VLVSIQKFSFYNFANSKKNRSKLIKTESFFIKYKIASYCYHLLKNVAAHQLREHETEFFKSGVFLLLQEGGDISRRAIVRNYCLLKDH